MSKVIRAARSDPETSTVSGRLPRFDRWSCVFVPKRPLTTEGRRSASSAPKGRKATEPSSTSRFIGSCSLVTLAPNGHGPALAAEVRGGWSVTWKRPTDGGESGRPASPPSRCGNSSIEAGVTVHQLGSRPTSSHRYRSTTAPRFRTSTVKAADVPGVNWTPSARIVTASWGTRRTPRSAPDPERTRRGR